MAVTYSTEYTVFQANDQRQQNQSQVIKRVETSLAARDV